MKKRKRIVYIIVGIILLIAVALNTYLLLKYKVLPPKFLKAYIIICVIIPVLMVLFTIFKKRKSKIKNTFLGIEVFLIIIFFIVFFYLNSTFNFLDNFTNTLDYETKNYFVVSLIDSNYKDISDYKNKKLGYTKGLDESIDKAVKELNTIVKINNEEYDGYGELLSKVDNKELDGFLILSSYYSMITETEDEEAGPKYKIVYEFAIKEKSKDIDFKEVDVTKEAFNIYLSGIDTYGGISDNTRSDVNMLVSINPKTNKILLINIPRDYYVELHDIGAKDKLTHAGIYGIDMSVKTIEDLLDTEINYYVKVNYNALINLVDALGGVDVYSEYTFSSYELHHRFKANEYNHVNGKQALDFARTRKAFQGGDRVRGENQQRLIEAIVKKASSASILVKYDDILNALKGNFVTNMSTNSIMSLINMQLDKMPSWSFETYSLNGKDSYQITYSYAGSELYVMIPDEETVNEAKNLLKENK